MKYFGFALCLALILGFTHKYYISNTLIHHNEEAQSLEISIKIFTDDFERALEEESGKRIKLGAEEEDMDAHRIIGDYLSKHLRLTIDKQVLELDYLGKEDEVDITRCYLEVTNVSPFRELTIANSILFNQFEEQANIVDVDFKDVQKQVILSVEHKSETIRD